MESSAELIVQNSREKVPIGTLLIADEIILPQDLDFALDHQKHSRRLIGEILITIGAMDRVELDAALMLQQKMKP